MIEVPIEAHAVSSTWGNEYGFGWNWVVNKAKYCNVYVILESNLRDDIQ